MMHQTHREKAIQRLEDAKNEDHALTSYYQLYQDLLQIQEEAELDITTSLEMVDEVILNERLRSGLPQLPFDHLSIDERSFRDLVQKILDLLLAYQDEKVDKFPMDEEDLITRAKERFMLIQTTDNSDLLGLAIDQALMPYLEHAAGQIMTHVDKSKWLQGNCPSCGGEPNFACLDEDGSRTLVCSRCRYQWRYKRTGCPFCSNTDPKTLRYYPAGEKKAYRLYVCDACKHYLKAIDQRIAGSDINIIVEPILTWSLDKAAREKGYH